MTRAVSELERTAAAQGRTGLVITPLRTFAAIEETRAEWAALVRASGPGSPFAHPAWSLTWARHFVPQDDLEYIAVRDTSGRLAGLAPFYRRRRSIGGLAVRTLQPIGTAHGDPLTESVHLTARPECAREVLKAVVCHLVALPNHDWVQVSVGDGQGWPLPQWLGAAPQESIVHRKARPSVVLDELPDDPDLVLGSLRRNLRESLRRARNRSARLGGISVERVTGTAEIGTAVRQLIWLHAQRAAMPGKVLHANMFGSGRDRFLDEAVVHLAREGLATVLVARHGRVPVAAQLVLSDGSTDYLSVSGLNPRYWDLNLNTLLVFTAVQDAVIAGRRSVNLSSGPNVAKMRWSSKLEVHHDFDIVAPQARSQALHGLYSHVALLRDGRQERRRHLVSTARVAEPPRDRAVIRPSRPRQERP